jgi:hypothetical protein
MPELNANIPPIECYVRGNFLRDQEDSHDKYFPCVIFGVSSIKSRSPLFHFLSNMKMSYIDRNKNNIGGKYLFTLDWHNPESNILDDGYSESPGQHKCGHVIQRDDGNFAVQPNNRIRLKEPSFVTKKDLVIQRLINTNKWDVEGYDKWVLEDSNAYDYDISETEVDK